MKSIWVIKKGDLYLSIPSYSVYFTKTNRLQTISKRDTHRVYGKAKWVKDLEGATKFSTHNHLKDALRLAGGSRVSYYREKARKGLRS